MKKTLFALAALCALPMLSCSKKESAGGGDSGFKAAFIYVSPVGDGGWTFAHDQGRKEMAKLPFVKEAFYMESVPEGADFARALRGVAKKGYNMIATTSFGYMDATVDVAKDFTDIKFLHCSGYKTAPNVSTYFGKIEQPRYLSGMVAGKLTKNNTLGYVAAFPIPEVIRGVNAFILGARSVNPDVKVKVVWTNTWFDPGVERAAADSLLSVGADVLAMHQDSPATLQAAEKAGKFVIGYNTDMQSFAPKAFLCAPVWNWGVYYSDAATKVHEGKWTSGEDWWGIDKGIVDLSPMTALVPEDVKALVLAKRQEMVDGKANPFAGPIKNQEGKEVVPAGSALPDKDILSMGYFVEGVEGTISSQ